MLPDVSVGIASPKKELRSKFGKVLLGIPALGGSSACNLAQISLAVEGKSV